MKKEQKEKLSDFISKEQELIQYVAQTPELVKIAIKRGLEDIKFIKISKEELLNYIKS